MDVNTPLATLAQNIAACLRTNTIAAIRGPAGVGKSEMVRSIARELGVNLYTLIGSLADPTDINGFPVVAQGVRVQSKYTNTDHPVLEFAPRRWMVDANGGEGAIIFLDELTSAPGPVRAAMLHLLTQWEAGDFKLDPNLVGFVTAFNDADEAVNGSELGFPMVNRLTHFAFPMTHEAVREWTNQFPGYWGHPKPVRFLGREIPEDFLMRARSSISGYIQREQDAWHYRLLMKSKGGKKDKEKSNEELSMGQHPQTGAPTPRSWDRVGRHVALAAAEGKHPLTAMARIVGEIGEGQAASFEVYLQNVSLPDPEEVIKNAESWNPSGRLDVDWATLMSVSAAIRGKLTPDRYEAGWKILASCADNGKGSKSAAYEAGAAAAMQLQPYLKMDGQCELLTSMKPQAQNNYIARILNLMGPYQQMGAVVSGRKKLGASGK